MTELMIRGVALDVLVIQDTAYKPYHLVKRYNNLHPGLIYTRVCDTSIPVTQTAPPDEIRANVAGEVRAAFVATGTRQTLLLIAGRLVTLSRIWFDR